MNTTNIFEVATRTKMRFPFRGVASVEDLWDLPVRDLDLVFKALNSKVKQAKEESLLDTKSKEDEILDMQIEIVKHIVTIKLEEENLKVQVKAQKEKKQKIMSIISAKQDEDLQNKSADELKKMLAEIDS